MGVEEEGAARSRTRSLLELIRENGGNILAMKGLGEGRSVRKERRKWALLPPTQPTSPPPEGPWMTEIWGLKWRLWKPERWSEEAERPGAHLSSAFSHAPPPLVLFFETISCLFLNPWLVSQDYSASPALVTLSTHSQGLG